MTSILLIDSDEHSAAFLLATLRHDGTARAERVAPGLDIPAALARLQPELVVFNHHFDRPDDLMACCAVRLAAPEARVVALAAAGPPLRELRGWAARTGYLDAVVEKPLPPGQLRQRLAELAAGAGAARALQERSRRIARLLPEGAIDALDGQVGGEEELFEAAVLFTDVRRSSELITQVSPRLYFQRLNASLSAQSTVVRNFRGAVVKYTGDGLMAVFRGMGRSHLAVRCAQELAAPASQEGLAFGIGVAQGLVLSGLVGASGDAGQRSQYDVIGATVHLAARLCALAGPAEVVATQPVLAASRLSVPTLRQHPALQVRGFTEPVACVAFGPAATPQPA